MIFPLWIYKWRLPCLWQHHLVAPTECDWRSFTLPSSSGYLLSCYFSVASVTSYSVRPQRRQPTRLCRPWDSPGKNTGVGCHFLQCMKVKSESEVAQSCLTLWDPMDCSLPGSSIHGIFQARVLEWGTFASSKVVSNSVAIPWTVADQAPVSIELPRQEYWSDFSEILLYIRILRRCGMFELSRSILYNIWPRTGMLLFCALTGL